MTEEVKTHLVAYCAGANSNVRYSGFGVLAYSYIKTAKRKNTKHPSKATLNFTETGIQKENVGENITTVSILEHIEAIESQQSTANEADVLSLLWMLTKTLETSNVETLTLITDSSYAFKAYTERLEAWEKSNWKKQNGEPVTHGSHWKAVLEAKRTLKSNSVTVKIIHIEDKTEDYAATVASLFAQVGANAAKVQGESPIKSSDTVLLSKTSTFAEYKDSYQHKDLIYFFKDIFFSSAVVKDVEHCFLSNDANERENGKRNNTSIFLTVDGVIPALVNKLKDFYRNTSRNYVVMCSVRLSRLLDKDILKLCELVPIQYMVRKVPNSPDNQFKLVGDDQVFLQEVTSDFPFVMGISKNAQYLTYIASKQSLRDKPFIYDVTDSFVAEGKLKYTNLDTYIDFSELVAKDIVLRQKLILHTGYDFPTYLTLKKIEADIQKVEFILHRQIDSNYYTLVTRITLTDRIVHSLNVVDKYLAVHL